MKITSTHILIAIATAGVLLLVGGKYFSVTENAVEAGQYTEFVQCIQESGAKFYGAFWCPHCADQKAIFGDANTLLPYIECSTEDKQGQTQECIDANIQSYPTWEFEEGRRVGGTLTPEQLSRETNCPLAS
jgi:hypothetical protein